MDYYGRLEKMYKLVITLCKENNSTIDNIVFDVMTNTGLPDKTISKYIDKLLEK